MVAISRVAAGSHVTLHYRIAVELDGNEHEVVSTFDARPATVQIGAGQFSEALEQRLIGLEEGQEASFDLAAGDAFGHRSAELVQTLTRGTFDANADPGVEYVPGDVVEFSAPDGLRFSGVLKQHAGDRVVVDFNHPLAGLPVRFSVRVIGVL
ncbi:MAG TPA: FKBP-type peptidyl-prolyl cis-trans isomerase [Burkholderiaceae bacterium]|nr:FKBP-type peptidyl-prolyl cis-trans isomerase [Burkholderiaceae bacterium]